MNEYKTGQLLMTKRDLFGESDKYSRGFQNVASPISSNYQRWQTVTEIGVPKFSVLFLVNVRTESDAIMFDTLFDNKTISFRCTSLEDASKKFIILQIPDIENLDVVDKWCTSHMGEYNSTVTGQVFLPRSGHESAIKGRYDEIVWSWGKHTFQSTYLEKGKPYIGIAVRRKSSTRTFFFEFKDEAGNYYCKEFRASVVRKYKNQALSDYFYQLKPNNKIPDPKNSFLWKR